MPIGGILGAFASGLGIAAQASAQEDQRNLGYLNLYETKRSNRQKEKLATATQTDARGNRIWFDPELGWQIDTSPQTQAILEAEDAETLASLTEDATRNRNSARRMEERALAAGEEFDEAFNEYRYRPERTEAEYIADAQKEALLARRKGADEAAANVNKSLIRQGNSSGIASVFREARDAEAEDFEQVLLGGKRRGIQDFLAIEGANDARMQQELGFLEGLASANTAMPQRFTNRADQLTASADQQMAELLQVLAGNDNSRSNAMATLMQAVGQSPDFAPLASALGRINFSGSGEAGPTKSNNGGLKGLSLDRSRLRNDF